MSLKGQIGDDFMDKQKDITDMNVDEMFGKNQKLLWVCSKNIRGAI